LARDGGLYLPVTWPQFPPEAIAAMAGKSYADVATEIMLPFVGDGPLADDLAGLVEDAYATFDHPAVVPLRQVGANDFVLELFHGPTFAFKDCALQLLGRLFDTVLRRRERRVTIVGATSGDTGSAAIEACRGREAIDIFILHPHDRVSEVQRRQMTTVADDNVHNIAIEGNFDDCQALVKALFNDQAFRDRHSLSAVNSINWARVMAQIVYYFTSAVSLGGPYRPVAFSVPTGNFGDVFAGYGAALMGLPVDRFLVATNRNDILTRFFETGEYRSGTVEPTMSPSMDIQVSSNFERLLYDLYDRDGDRVRGLMDGFAQSGAFAVPGSILDKANGKFSGLRTSESETARTIDRVLRETGDLIDPHTAVGLHAAGVARQTGLVAAETPLITLSTAHPAKFPAAVEQSCGRTPEMPAKLAMLMDLPERFDVLPHDLSAVQTYISERATV
jgi:threonine synthase